jgi:photosystem II stability/assembly factor-like uncharacterized protein
MRWLTMFLLSGLALMASDTLLMKSDDAGRTWTDISPDPSDRFLHCFQIDTRGSTLYALTHRDLGDEWHLFVSTDAGQTWQARQRFSREIYWISAAADAGNDTLYLAYERYGYPKKDVVIAKVTDFGRSLEQYSADGLAVWQDTTFTGSLTTLKTDPLSPARLYSLVTQELCCNGDIFALFQALWVSGDDGRNWARIEPPVPAGCTYPELQIDAHNSSVYVACGNTLLKSTDGGASWSAKAFPDGTRIWNLQNAGLALLGSRLGAIWGSDDGADAWQPRGAFPMGADQRFLSVHPEKPFLLFVSTQDGIQKSGDGGKTWTGVTEYPFQAELPFNLVIGPQQPETFYLVNWMRQKVGLRR